MPRFFRAASPSFTTSWPITETRPPVGRSNPENAKIGTYHTQLFSYYLDRLAATPDGEGSLLDQMTIVYGSSMSDGNAHAPRDLPLLVLGGPAGSAGRHIRAPEDTPFSNLQLSLLDKIGVPGVEHFGDSTGRFDVFTDV